MARFGRNALPEKPPTPLWWRFLQQFRSPLIYILLFALVIDLGIWLAEGAQDVPVESIAIALILLLNAGLGVYQERKAEAALARLKALATALVWTLRDGTLVRLASDELVPGDVVRVEAGDRVPADGLLQEGQGVMVDESILTGESVPVDKEPAAEVFSGTLFVRGRGYVEVTRTGPASAMGRLATMIGTIAAEKTPLERRLHVFAGQIAKAVIALSIVLIAGGLVVEGTERFGHVFLFAVALAVAAIPEGLPAVLTLTLALGVERMATRKAIVRRLSAVEALGSVTVIATDKTGTLTENRMFVKDLDSPDRARALRAMIFANDAEAATKAGDPLELALLEYAQGQGLDPIALGHACPRESSRPFDSAYKFMRVTVREESGPTSYLKGAPEVILSRCRFAPAERKDWEERANRHAAEGARVLALAGGAGEAENHVDFLGLVLLWDPPRTEVPAAMRQAQAAGIRVIMITGDHPATAMAVARAVGIPPSGVLTGADLERMPPGELQQAVCTTNVFARVAPEHKLHLVETLKRAGEIVAVTGDGVNDAPALKRSDVGVAMGQRGSDVSREVADLVLMDDNFATIVAAIEEGRSIYENIQKFIRFLFSTNVALVLLVTLGLGASWLFGMEDVAGGLFLPLTAVQLLWINVIADGPPALALALDRNPGVMTQPPRNPRAPLLDRLSLQFILVTGVVKAVVGVVILMLLPRLGYGPAGTRTAVFLYESLAQLVFAYPARRITVLPLGNLALHAAIVLGAGLQFLTLVMPALQELLALQPLDARSLLAVVAGVGLSWGTAEMVSRWRWNARRAASTPAAADQMSARRPNTLTPGDDALNAEGQRGTLVLTERNPTEPQLLDVVELTLHDLQPEAPVAPRAMLDSSLDRDLALDSLARMELLLRIERTFGVDLPEDTLQRAETVRDLLHALERVPDTTMGRTQRTRQPVLPPRTALPESGEEAQAAATTLLEVLDWHVQAHPQQVQSIIVAEESERRITYGELASAARAVASALQHAGIEPGQTVAIMLPTSAAYFHCYFGILMAGAIPVPIYPPARASQLEDHVLRHAGILANAQTALLITVGEAMVVARLLQARVPAVRHVVTPEQLGVPSASAPPLAPSATAGLEASVGVRGEDIAFIQYTSGSTGNPKGVVLTHANLLANIRAMAQTVAASPRDVFVSWLPLYHDMGLIGAFLGSLYVGFPLVVMSPLAFLAKPERWLWAIHRYRGTLSAAPNFAYELCLKRIDDAALAGLDLSSWRLAFNGAEAVGPDTVLRFAERFARYGLRREAVTPVYGLAEASVGLLFPPLERGPLIDRIQREPFARERRALPAAADDATAQRFVACGRPLPGHAIRIVDEAGQEVGERIEGRLEFKGPSATSGYFRNPVETARLFHDGWLDTGDRAYVAAGEIYLTGRVKDIVIRGGRNIYPQEIEDAVGAVEGVRKGGVAVFGSPDPSTGTERLVVLVETRATGGSAYARLREAVARAVLEVLGEPPDVVVLAPPHTVLKTSSGKVRRSACRALYEEGRVGAAPPTARLQFMRLALGAAGLRLRFGLAAAGRAAFALYAWLVFWLLAPATWIATLATRTPAAAWRLGGAAARLLLRLTGVPLTVRGLEHLPHDRPCVLVSNHASYLDGMILVAALPQPYAFVAKRELADQFVAGIYLKRLGAEFVERFDVKRSVEDANRMAALVTGGRSLLVFPEGTFVARPGLLPFHLGGFLAAAGAAAPIVPVTIRGSRAMLPAHHWWPRRGALEVEIGAPLQPPPREAEDVFAAAVKLRSAARAGIARNLEATDASGA